MTSSRTVIHLENDPLWQAKVADLVGAQAKMDYIRLGPVDHSTSSRADECCPSVIIVEPFAQMCDPMSLYSTLHRIFACTPLIILSAHVDDVTISQLRIPHVCGLIWKPQFDSEVFMAAISAAKEGRRSLPREIQRAWQQLRAQPNAFFKVLSDRELMLLPFLGRGLSDSDIADIHGIARATIKSHRENILRKLSLPNTVKLVQWTHERGFIRSAYSPSFDPNTALQPSTAEGPADALTCSARHKRVA
jgi:two-component system response regulator NreC